MASRDRGASDKLIVALDVSSYDAARDLVLQLGPTVSFYKIGLELLFAGGLELAGELLNEDKRVFLDLKFLDIGHTVERAVASAAALGVDFLTVHGHDSQSLKAAVRGRGAGSTQVLAVTVLTSLDQADIDEQGIISTPEELVLKRARLAAAAGADGVIASGLEAAAVRAATSPQFLIITPGIRLPDGERGDQSRITTPADAIMAGANHIVVGRPITQASNPRQAAEHFQMALAAAASA